MQQGFRCNCPITSSIDILGDKWMLVIVKQMLLEKKMTFKDFSESEEAIATNILSAKLKRLQEAGIVVKMKLRDNKKTNLYVLTERGLALTPLLIELAVWGLDYLPDIHPSIEGGQSAELLKRDKDAFSRELVERYRKIVAEGGFLMNEKMGGSDEL